MCLTLVIGWKLLCMIGNLFVFVMASICLTNTRTHTHTSVHTKALKVDTHIHTVKGALCVLDKVIILFLFYIVHCSDANEKGLSHQ